MPPTCRKIDEYRVFLTCRRSAVRCFPQAQNGIYRLVLIPEWETRIMPRLAHALPKYRKHRGSGQAVVTLNGREFYLGPHGTKASKIEYDRLIGEWLANGHNSLHSTSEDIPRLFGSRVAVPVFAWRTVVSSGVIGSSPGMSSVLLSARGAKCAQRKAKLRSRTRTSLKRARVSVFGGVRSVPPRRPSLADRDRPSRRSAGLACRRSKAPRAGRQ